MKKLIALSAAVAAVTFAVPATAGADVLRMGPFGITSQTRPTTISKVHRMRIRGTSTAAVALIPTSCGVMRTS